MGFSRTNALDQALDIAGSLTQAQNYTIASEPLGYGAAISGQTGSTASITTFASNIVTLTGLTGMTQQSVGNMLTISGAASAGNNGTFLIAVYNSATSVGVFNTGGVASDANSGAISWTERKAYSLEDDLNYVRTDRRLIKGTTNFYDAVPTYERPTAIGTNVPANLTNIAGKTTDAQGFIFSRVFRAASVSATDTEITISSVGNLKHADAVDKTGVPCFDVAPYSTDRNACYVLITDPENDNQLEAVGGAVDGYAIFGLTNNGSSTSPNSVEVLFYAVKHGADISTAVPYTWDGYQPTTIDLTYGYFTRLDQADEYSFRRLLTLGVQSDADLRQDVDDLQLSVGVTDGYRSLAGLLTNTASFYPFFDLPDATPTVVEALNTLNEQIGDRNYSGATLTDGETVTQSLQALSDAIGSSSAMIRTIERLAADITSNTAHTLPGGLSYTVDGTNNGSNLWVYTRGVLRDPGPISAGNDYEETSTTTITFYTTQKTGDHINYFTKS